MGGAVPSINGHPYYLFYMNNVWLLTDEESFENCDGRAFLKLETEGLNTEKIIQALKIFRDRLFIIGL